METNLSLSLSLRENGEKISAVTWHWMICPLNRDTVQVRDTAWRKAACFLWQSMHFVP